MARAFKAAAAAAILLASAGFMASASTQPYWLLALSKTDHVLAIVDPATLQTVARVPVGPDPHEVIAAPDGRTAYVSNTGYGSFHEIDVIDLAARKALPSIDTQPLMGPHGLAYVGGELWFTAQGAKAIGRYDPTTARIDWAMGTGQNTTHMIYVSPDAKRIYTTNVDSGTVSLFENVLVQPTVPPTGVLSPGAKPHMDWLQTILPVGKGAEGFDVSPDGRELWTATPQGSLSIIDLAGKKVAATIDTGVLGLHRLKFTPDGQRVLMVSVRTGDLVVYDARSRREIKRLRIGRGAGIMMDAEGNRAFISCTPDNYVSVIDLKSLEEVKRLDIGGRPDGMAVATRARGGRIDRRAAADAIPETGRGSSPCGEAGAFLRRHDWRHDRHNGTRQCSR